MVPGSVRNPRICKGLGIPVICLMNKAEMASGSMTNTLVEPKSSPKRLIRR